MMEIVAVAAGAGAAVVTKAGEVGWRVSGSAVGGGGGC